jgi:hypothetical protein
MAKLLGVLSAALVVLAGLFFFASGVSDHSYTVTLVKNGADYEVQHKSLIEVDWSYTTTITVENKTAVDLYFVFDGGPNGEKCRVDFTPNEPGKCETQVLKVLRTAPTTFTMTAKDMGRYDYSYFKAGGFAIPRYKSDFKVSDDPTKPPKKIDPDLEIERDPPPPLLVLSTLLAGILLGVGAWVTRRRR